MSSGDGDGDVDAGEIGEYTLLGDLERAGDSLLPLQAGRLATLRETSTFGSTNLERDRL